MKKICSYFTLLIAFVFAISTITVTAGAVNLNNATVLSPLKSASFMNSSKVSKSYLFKITLADSGKICFFRASDDVTSSAKLSVLTSNGKSAVSGSFSDMIGKTISINKKGTYYAQIILSTSQSVKGFGYTYVAKSGKNVSKSISINTGDKLDCSSYVKDFRGTLKWTTSNKSIAKITTKGIITGVNSGSAKVRVYSSNGDYAQFSVKVAGSENFSVESSNSTILQKVSGGKTYNLSEGGSAEFNKYVGNLESYGIFNYNTSAKKGDTFKLKVNTSGTITWESKNPYVATVDNAGNVKVLKKGTASIVAKIGNKQYSCWIDALAGDSDYVTIQSGRETLYGGAYLVARSEGETYSYDTNQVSGPIASTSFDFILLSNEDTSTSYESNKIYVSGNKFNGLKFTKCKTIYANKTINDGVLDNNIVRIEFETTGSITVDCKVTAEFDPAMGDYMYISDFGQSVPQVQSFNIDIENISETDRSYLSNNTGKRVNLTINNYHGVINTYFYGFTSVDVTKINK